MTPHHDPIVSTTFTVRGVSTDHHVRGALQALYDVFADLDIGQAAFEVTDAETTRLIVKHKKSVAPDRDAIRKVLADTGDFRLVD